MGLDVLALVVATITQAGARLRFGATLPAFPLTEVLPAGTVEAWQWAAIESHDTALLSREPGGLARAACGVLPVVRLDSERRRPPSRLGRGEELSERSGLEVVRCDGDVAREGVAEVEEHHEGDRYDRCDGRRRAAVFWLTPPIAVTLGRAFASNRVP